jgi:hypothetical protein
MKIIISIRHFFLIFKTSMEGGELFAKISERTTPFTEQGLFKI